MNELAERRRSLLGWHGKIRIPIFLDVVGHSTDVVVIATDSAQLDESGIMSRLLVLPLWRSNI